MTGKGWSKGKLYDEGGQVPLEVYHALRWGTPEERNEIVLRLIEEHPHHRLELPVRDGEQAVLEGVGLGRQALEGRLRAGVAAWWNASARGIGLIGAELEGAILTHADLKGAVLSNARLKGASLAFVDGEGATFVHLDLQGATLRGARLTGADLSGADLAGASLAGADLRDASLAHCRLDGANLNGAHLEGANLRGCDLSAVGLGKAWLDRTQMTWSQIGDMIDEEAMAADVAPEERATYIATAKSTYLTLKRNFGSLGDYDSAAKAYCKEMRMGKLEAWWGALASFRQGEPRAGLERAAKCAGHQAVEMLCAYGESVWRVIGWLVVLWLAFPLLYGMVQGVWVLPENPGVVRVTTWDMGHLLRFSLANMVTLTAPGLQARPDAVMATLMPLQTLVGIFLTGLLGFVAGNRIRRS